MITITRPILAAILAASLLGACGDDGGDADADATIDAAATIDAPTFDAGPTFDAAVFDAGPTFDAVVFDAGPTFDAVPVSSDLRINEFVMDHNGASDTGEFVELRGTASTNYSAYKLVQINGDNFDTGIARGVVVSVHDVGTTDANGYFLPTIAANTFENGTQTLLLVHTSTAAVADDIDADDDGTIDNPLWAEIIDAVAVFDGVPDTDNTDRTYAGGAVLNKSVSPLVFGGASRIPDGTDTDSAGDWVSNTPKLDNTSAVSGQALNTPGAVNAVEP